MKQSRKSLRTKIRMTCEVIAKNFDRFCEQIFEGKRGKK